MIWNVVILLEKKALSIGVWVTGKLWDQLSMSSPAFEKLEYIVISMSKWCLMGFLFQKGCVFSMIRTIRGSFLECLLIYDETKWHLEGITDLWCVTHELPPWAFLLILLLSVSCSFLFMHGFQNVAFLLIKVLFSLVYSSKWIPWKSFENQDLELLVSYNGDSAFLELLGPQT